MLIILPLSSAAGGTSGDMGGGNDLGDLFLSELWDGLVLSHLPSIIHFYSFICVYTDHEVLSAMKILVYNTCFVSPIQKTVILP